MSTTAAPEVVELVERGKVLYSMDKYDEAIRSYKEAIALDKYYEPAYENLGVCYVMADKYKEAKNAFNRYLMLNKTNGVAYFHLGNVALLENNPTEAKAMYSKAELCGYQPTVMYLNLASYFEESGDYEAALSQYTKLLRVSPYAYDIMERQTQLLLRTGDFEQALSSAKKMLQTDIDRFEGHRYTYISLIMLKRFDEALKYIGDVRRRFPDNDSVKFDQLRLMDLTGNTDGALTELEKEFPDCAELSQVALLKLGLLLQKQRLEDAVALVESSQALQREPNALTMLYSVYYSRGNYPKALEYCQKILDMGEESPQYYAAWYFRALAASKTEGADPAASAREFAKVSGDLRQILLKHAERLDLNMYRALCEYQLGHYDEAVKLMEYLTALRPEEASFHLALAMALEAAGKAEEAEQHRDRARELDPNAAAPLV